MEQELGAGAQQIPELLVELVARAPLMGAEDLDQLLGQAEVGLIGGVDVAGPDLLAVDPDLDEVGGQHGSGLYGRGPATVITTFDDSSNMV